MSRLTPVQVSMQLDTMLLSTDRLLINVHRSTLQMASRALKEQAEVVGLARMIIRHINDFGHVGPTLNLASAIDKLENE